MDNGEASRVDLSVLEGKLEQERSGSWMSSSVLTCLCTVMNQL